VAPFRVYAVYLRDEITPGVSGAADAIDPDALKGFRPSYRYLSYCFASAGYQVPDDLAGIERSDLVDALVHDKMGRPYSAPLDASSF
jgi:hypothetical protein